MHASFQNYMYLSLMNLYHVSQSVSISINTCTLIWVHTDCKDFHHKAFQQMSLADSMVS